MGAFSDNFYSWLDKEHAAEKAAMDGGTFKKEDHPRVEKGKEGAGQFTKKPENVKKEDDRDVVSALSAPKKSVKSSNNTNSGNNPQSGTSSGPKNKTGTSLPTNGSVNTSGGGTKFKDATPEEFAEAIAAAKKNCSSADQWRVDAYPAEHYKDSLARIVTPKGSCIAVQKNGDMISLCRSANEDKAVHGRDLMAEAIRRGGDRCDTFEGNFQRYVAAGMDPVSWIRWNPDPDIRPSEWKESVNQPEDVIFFMYTGRHKGEYNAIDLEQWKKDNPPFEGEDCYNEAQKARDKALEDFQNRNEPNQEK